MHNAVNPPQQKQGKIRFISIFALLVICGGLLLGVKIYIAYSKEQIISPLPVKTSQNPLVILFPKKSTDLSQLISKIKEIIDKQTGIYSVYVFDMNQNIGYGIQENTIFTAASVNKIPILAALYYEAQQGKIDLDERVTIQPEDIQDYGTGVIRSEGPGGVYSLKSLAQLMMQKSDNTAAYILANLIGEAHIQELVTKWGLTQTDITNNKTSNVDIALLMTKMFKGQIANTSNSLEMLGFMTASDFENRLPALLPKTIKVYHKIGSEVGSIHDVGIVAFADHPYYIGVFTADTPDETTSENTIAQISKLTFDFMNNQ